jgi:PBSX family phage terminase large subunit
MPAVNLFPKQDDFLRATEPEVLLSGASGYGKSVVLCLNAIQLATYPGSRIGIVRKVAASIPESTLVTLKRCLADLLPESRYRFEDSETKVVIKGGGEILLFGVADETRLGSKELTHCFVDEATELEEGQWAKLITLCRLPTHDGRPNQIKGVCNPDHPKHWLALRFKIRQDWFADSFSPDPTKRLFMVKSRENPTLPQSFLKALEHLPETKRKRLLEGLWASAEGLVYPMFSDSLHVVDRSEDAGSWRKVIVAVDDGTDPDPFCALRIGVDGNGRAHVEEELYARNVRLSNRARMVAALAEDADRIVVDPSAKALRLEMLNLSLPVSKALNDREEGVDRVAERFGVDADGLPMLTISPNCRNLLAELYAYQRDKDGNPKDGNDHACFVAETLIATPTGPRRIADIQVGELVSTPLGPRRVLASGLTDTSATVYRVRFSNGTEIRATANHPVFVIGKGWTAVDSLEYADRVVWKPTTKPQSQSSTTGGPTAAIPTRRAGLTAATTSAADGMANPSTSIGESSRTTTDQSQTATTFTTATATPTTTTPQTSLPFPRRSIQRTTRRTGSHTRGIESTLSVSDRSRLNGIAARRAGLGTLSMEGKSGRPDSPRPSAADIAERSTAPSPSAPQIGSVPPVAALPNGAGAELTTNAEPARIAVRRSASTATQRRGRAPVAVVSTAVEPERCAVYNLTVEGAHCYYANGVLAHNCDALRYGVMALDRGLPSIVTRAPLEKPTDRKDNEAVSLKETVTDYYERKRRDPDWGFAPNRLSAYDRYRDLRGRRD